MLDLETTCRIHEPSDDPLNGTVSVRVLFNAESGWENYENIHVYGVFRLADDSEVDYTTLSKDNQQVINKSCEEYMKEYKNDKKDLKEWGVRQ